MSDTIRATMHGMYVGSTGDRTRLRQLAAEARLSNTVTRAWQNTGRYLDRAMNSVFQAQARSLSRD